MHQRQHPHHLLARQQRDTDRGLRTQAVCIVRAHQPAVVLARIRDVDALAVLDHPSREAAFHRFAHLLGGVLVDLRAVDDGGVHGFAGIIQNDNTATFAAHVLQGLIHHTLQAPCASRGRLPAPG
jgi:hypothetical protein